MNIKTRVVNALVGRFRSLNPRIQMVRDDYTAQTLNNLKEAQASGQPTLKAVMDAFKRGDSRELEDRGKSPPRMNAVHSSSALLVNTFAIFSREPQSLALGSRRSFRSVEFEKRLLATPKGKPSNLDLLAGGFEGVVAIEARLLEILDRKPDKVPFSEHYSFFRNKPNCEAWYEQVIKLNRNPTKFVHLDAKQLISHALGLTGTYGPSGVILLYLFWEPKNAESIEEYRRHRREVSAFLAEVRGAPVGLAALSYQELWRQWEENSREKLVLDQVRRLRERYVVEI